MFLFCLVFAMFCARLFICALWSPAGKGLTSWLSFVVSTVSLSLSHWYPGSGVVLNCIDSWSLHPNLFCNRPNSVFWGWLSMESQPQNTELRYNLWFFDNNINFWQWCQSHYLDSVVRAMDHWEQSRFDSKPGWLRLLSVLRQWVCCCW